MTFILKRLWSNVSSTHDTSLDERHDDRRDIRRVNRLFLPLLAAALVAAISVGWNAGATGPILLWVFACLSAGGTAGFLFGIPRSGVATKTEDGVLPAGRNSTEDAAHPAGKGTHSQIRPNTNLEEVSDWVTKILVGLTLVNLKELQDGLARLSSKTAAVLHNPPTAADLSIAMSLIIGFSLLGFLSVYLYTRLFIQGAMKRSDDWLVRYQEAISRAERVAGRESNIVSRHDKELGETSAQPVLPSAESLRAAQAVADVAPSNSPNLILQPLRQLAVQYEELRRTAEYSTARTQKMTDIVRRMRPHAIAAAPYIEELIRSTSTGDHLAATVIMQMSYQPDQMEWLARRLVEERAFIGYQAASALLARVQVAGITECRLIQSAVARAKADRAAANVVEDTLDRLIDRILIAK